MKHHIIETTKTVVNLHPEIMDKLKGMARWMAVAYAVKIGEAPDDKIRRSQEQQLQDDLVIFLLGQLNRIIKELKGDFVSIPLSFWDDEERKMWSELSGNYVGILVSALNGGINALPPELVPLVDEMGMRQRLIDFATTYRNKWPKNITETTMKFINETILKWQESGDPLSELIKTLSNPDLGMFNEARAELIAVTEVTRLHALGNMLAWQQTGYIKEFRWNTANDERVCQICGPRNYEVFPLSFIEDNMPAHPRCLPGNTNVLPGGLVSAGSKRWYEGNVVTIETPENKLTVTPNHPVLSRRGWVAAGDLVEGDYILGYSSADWESALVSVNKENRITRIEDIFSSLDLNGFRVPTAAPDFHGDGAGSNVAIIRPNSKIMNNIEASVPKPIPQENFLSADVVSDVPFSGLGSGALLLKTNYSASSGVMGGLDLVFAFLLGHTRPLDSLGLRLSPWSDIGVEELGSESETTNSKLFGKFVFGLPFNITLQKIVNIRNDKFAGHVYNLQTESEMYLANGIITHNCRCWSTPVVDIEAFGDTLDFTLEPGEYFS